MARERTGAIVPLKRADGTTYYRGRILLQDKAKEWIDLPGILATEAGAHEARRQYIAVIQRDEDREHGFYLRKVARKAEKTGKAPPALTETVDAYFWRRQQTRKHKTAGNDAGRYKKWVQPVIGPLNAATLTPDDLRRLVVVLDEAVDAGVTQWKNATNIWGVVTKLCKDMVKSKRPELRIRTDNPAADVLGPERGGEKAKPYLWPSNLHALFVCPRVPVRWLRVFVLTIYTYPRLGELAALEWPDVHLDAGYILYHQAEDEDGDVDAIKTKDTRKVPIEPTLRPLLEVMKRESGGTGRVLVMPPREELAARLRKYLEWAGVTRADLFVSPKDKTRMRLRYHSLRDTGITWRAIRGDEPLKIMRAAGHDDLRTTQGYIAEAEVFSDAERLVFPQLPERVLHPSDRTMFGPNSPSSSASGGDCMRIVASPEGVEESERDFEAELAEEITALNADEDGRILAGNAELSEPIGLSPDRAGVGPGLLRAARGVALLMADRTDEYALALARAMAEDEDQSRSA